MKHVLKKNLLLEHIGSRSVLRADIFHRRQFPVVHVLPNAMVVQLRTCPIHPHDRSMRARSAGMGNCPTNDRPLFIGCFLACNMAVCTKLSQKPPLQTIVRCISCNARLAVRLSLLSSPAKLFVQEFYFVRGNEKFAIRPAA